MAFISYCGVALWAIGKRQRCRDWGEDRVYFVVDWCCVGFADDVIVAVDVDGFDAGSSLVLVRASNNLVYFVPRSFVWPSTGASLASLNSAGDLAAP